MECGMQIGDVAHMVERSLCMREVQGSIPCISNVLIFGLNVYQTCSGQLIRLAKPGMLHMGTMRLTSDCADIASRSSAGAGRLLNALRQHSAHELRTSMDRLKLITAWDMHMLQVSIA